MYTKVTPKAGQNGPMWLYVGSTPTFLAFWLGITYNYFSMMVMGYMVKFQARFVLQRSPFQVIPTPCPWTQNLTCKVRRTGTRGQETSAAGPFGSRRSAGRTPQMLPPAGPSPQAPSRPGEAKSRSREAPRCPHQF